MDLPYDNYEDNIDEMIFEANKQLLFEIMADKHFDIKKRCTKRLTEQIMHHPTTLCLSNFHRNRINDNSSIGYLLNVISSVLTSMNWPLNKDDGGFKNLHSARLSKHAVLL